MCLVIKNATRFSWILFSGDSYQTMKYINESIANRNSQLDW